MTTIAAAAAGWRGKKTEQVGSSSSFMCWVTQLCLTLCNPKNCSLPGSSVHGIFQARILEQVAISFSKFHIISYLFISKKKYLHIVQFSSVAVVSDSLRFYGLQHARPPCPSPTPWAYSNSCPLSRWSHSTTSSSIVPFSSCLQSFPASGSFLMSQLFTWGVQSIGVSCSTSVLPMNIQDWFP